MTRLRASGGKDRSRRAEMKEHRGGIWCRAEADGSVFVGLLAMTRSSALKVDELCRPSGTWGCGVPFPGTHVPGSLCAVATRLGGAFCRRGVLRSIVAVHGPADCGRR